MENDTYKNKCHVVIIVNKQMASIHIQHKQF